MFFGKNQNNSGDKVNVNTTVLRSYSDSALLTLRAWNNQLAVNLAPAVGKDSNGLTQYESEFKKQISTAITPKNAHALMEGITEKVLPAIKDGKAASVSVAAGNNDSRKIITIGYDGTDGFISISTNLNENGVAGNTFTHKFAKSSWLEGYNPETGSFDGERNTEAELMEVISRIDHIKYLDGMIAHSVKYDKAVRSAFSNSNNANNGGNAPAGGGYTAPNTNFTGQDMGDFLPFN